MNAAVEEAEQLMKTVYNVYTNGVWQKSRDVGRVTQLGNLTSLRGM